MKPIILFINNESAACGVYQHGLLVSKLLLESTKYNIIYKECGNIQTYVQLFNDIHPDIIIYNYHPSLFEFIVANYYTVIQKLDNVKHIGLITDGTQDILLHENMWKYLKPNGPVGTAFCPQIFDRYLFMDPETIETQYIKKVLPTIPKFDFTNIESFINDKVIVSSFGFGGKDKGYIDLINRVQDEFDFADIRLHIPFATYGDADGAGAKERVAECQAAINKPGIQLIPSHNFMTEQEVLEFLYKSDINIFMYVQDKGNMGIASTPHFAIAVKKPFLVQNASKTRHLIGISPEVDINKTTIKEALVKGSSMTEPFNKVWSRENTLLSYENVLDNVMAEEHFFGAGNPPIDAIIASTFPDNYIGNCIDVGAADGRLGSNTLYFERKGWNCLCIEPNPIYEEYLRDCRDNVVMAAITSNAVEEERPLHIFKVLTTKLHDGDPVHQHGAMTSLEVDKKLYEQFKNKGMILEEYDDIVKVWTLTECIERNNFPTTIDFISIDTEGTELDVLKSIDFNKIKVIMFVVENNFGTHDIEDYLKPFGYRRIPTNGVNDLYILESYISKD